MKQVICPSCHNRKEVKNNIILSICPGCLVEYKTIESKVYTNGLGTFWNEEGEVIKC